MSYSKSGITSFEGFVKLKLVFCHEEDTADNIMSLRFQYAVAAMGDIT